MAASITSRCGTWAGGSIPFNYYFQLLLTDHKCGGDGASTFPHDLSFHTSCLDFCILYKESVALSRSGYLYACPSLPCQASESISDSFTTPISLRVTKLHSWRDQSSWSHKSTCCSAVRRHAYFITHSCCYFYDLFLGGATSSSRSQSLSFYTL